MGEEWLVWMPDRRILMILYRLSPLQLSHSLAISQVLQTEEMHCTFAKVSYSMKGERRSLFD